MHRTNADLADLNLLRVFLAIWDLRSLTAAGERLGLSQPAVSHALRRLRTHFDDPLFVRHNTEMTPTEAAVRLHGPLDEAFQIIAAAMQQHGRFDAATAARTFRVCMSDMSEYYFLPTLLAQLEASAPSIRFVVVQHPVETLAAAMRAGEIDVSVGYLPGLGEGCLAQRLFADEHVCVVRAGHPLATGASLDRTALAQLRYVFAETNATGHRRVEQWFADEGLARDIVLRLPHFTIAPEIVRNTDLAVILPRSIAVHFNRDGAFRLLTLPFALPPIDVSVYLHERFVADAGIAWLRDTFVATFARE